MSHEDVLLMVAAIDGIAAAVKTVAVMIGAMTAIRMVYDWRR